MDYNVKHEIYGQRLVDEAKLKRKQYVHRIKIAMVITSLIGSFSLGMLIGMYI